MREVDENSVYVVVDKKIRARLTFDSPRWRVLNSVDVTDRVGRFFLDADLDSATYGVTLFAPDDPSGNSPATFHYQDSDGDGIVDIKRDWNTGTIYHLEGTPRWVEADSQ